MDNEGRVVLQYRGAAGDDAWARKQEEEKKNTKQFYGGDGGVTLGSIPSYA
jgi:hypothetical protein